MEFHKTDRAVETPSSLQVKQPIYNSSVGSWKKYSKHLEPLVQALAELQKIKAAEHKIARLEKMKALVLTVRNAYLESFEAAVGCREVTPLPDNVDGDSDKCLPGNERAIQSN
ncbi:MAG: hypothetical protein DRR42_19715 [Gammaproteobacteria bacterium]|nr:MAG: hypothetical protein DRR42_19715 [Gammaproteobacteria bacterium]